MKHKNGASERRDSNSRSEGRELANKIRLIGAFLYGASEETFDSRSEGRELANKIRLIGAFLYGASEETLTLDLFLGKEAL